MKLLLLVAALVASAAAVRPADKSQTQASIDAAVEYFKAPEWSSSQATVAAAKRKKEKAAAAAVEYFKASAPSDDRAWRAAATEVPPIVTHIPAKPYVPMANYTAAAKTIEEKEQMQKNVAAWRQYRHEMHNSLLYCQTRQNVSAAVSDKLMNLGMENVGCKEQCYVYCVLEQLGDYNTESLQMEKLRQSVGAFVGMERLNRVLDTCHTIKAGSLCESAYKFIECYRQNMLNIRKVEDKPAHTYVWLVQVAA